MPVAMSESDKKRMRQSWHYRMMQFLNYLCFFREPYLQLLTMYKKNISSISDELKMQYEENKRLREKIPVPPTVDTILKEIDQSLILLLQKVQEIINKYKISLLCEDKSAFYFQNESSFVFLFFACSYFFTTSVLSRSSSSNDIDFSYDSKIRSKSVSPNFV